MLVDADLVAFRCAATAEKDEEWVATSRTNDLFESILDETKATEWKSFLSGKNNFRKEIYPAYKANRTKPPPRWLEACRDLLIREWGTLVTNGCEADDALGVESTRSPDAVVASIDKDLRQLPAQHYNFVKKEMEYITAERAIREFYLSMLIGDASDNIRGVVGIGKAKAPRILEGCETEEELFNTVRDCYGDDEEMLLNGQLLWIWRTYGGTWNPEQLKQEAVQP